MFVCEFALLFGRIYSSKSLFFWSAPRLRDFSKKKSEWEPRENNIRPRKDRERVYFANRPAFLFHPHDFLPFYDDDLNKHQTEREEREERMRASFSKRSRCCSSSSCSSSSSSKFVYCSHFTSLELFFSIPNAVVIFVDFAFHSRSQISPCTLSVVPAPLRNHEWFFL